jgi:hypothetical protein
MDEEGLARFLGWFSIGLGISEALAPKQLAQLIGVKDEGENPQILLGLGLRELTSGLGILANPKPGGWLWGRVGGDAMDLTLLGVALASNNNNKNRVLMAIGAILGVTALDLYASTKLSTKSDPTAVNS